MLIRFSLILFVTTCATAASFEDQAQALLDAQVKESGVAGVSAGIMRDGKIIWLGGSGYRDVENQIPADGDMFARIASITKSMTATAIMQLEETKKLKLKDPVRKYVKQYPKKDRGTPRIEHLLTHTSGTRHYQGKENRPFDHFETLDEAIALFMGRRLAFEPGSRYLYTTYGYTLLGAVIEAASKQSYEAYMQEHIWDKACMKRTALEIRGKTAPDQSKLYRFDGENGIIEDEYTDLSVKYPGGGLVSTAEDLLRFGDAFISGKLVSQKTIDRMLTVKEVPKQSVPYALGWMVFDHPDWGKRIHNDGGQAGTSTTLDIYPEKGIVVAVLCNVYRAGEPINAIANGLVRLALEE
jgi:CubicO group peptidase (beta-lactamase class C family)